MQTEEHVRGMEWKGLLRPMGEHLTRRAPGAATTPRPPPRGTVTK